ncbi:Protein YffB [Vibrio stylophorae]|uniref:Protein YffB n=1 Tax=Vibrio stylophorae TaxID=659351 RepID=A0ABN8DVW0_9VIBR|nr:ArsC family reductase [Vibrio stylophorae]CAH0534172.1 Protein YffB [Vibrio stylophorae]
MTTILYGIANCDTIKKAKKWLEQAGVDYQFHDYRKQGIDTDLVQSFFTEFGWEQVLNKRGTTYRQLDQATKDALDEQSALALLVAQPAMIKRPILRTGDQSLIGFKAEQYQSLFVQ